jgi:glycine oxidase
VKTYDVIIAGAGIIGMSLALELRGRGADVLVLDRGEPGREASSAAAGMLAAADPETPELLRPLAFESARLFPEFIDQLQSQSGIKADFRRHGTIAILHQPDVLPHHRRLSGEELAQLEPALRTNGNAAFFLNEDSVDPELLIRAAVTAALRAAIEVRGHTGIDQMRRSAEHVEVIAARERFLTKAAVNCCGAWAGAPVRPRKGQMLYLQPKKHLLEHVVRAPEVYIMPRTSGKILVGATVEDIGFDKTVHPEMIEQLHAAAIKYVPELASAPVVTSWAGLRPGTPDDLPILGPTETPGIYIASGHFRNGILLAPVTAKVMADVVMGKQPQLDLTAFSIERFAASRT